METTQTTGEASEVATEENTATDLALDRQVCFPLYAASNLLLWMPLGLQGISDRLDM